MSEDIVVRLRDGFDRNLRHAAIETIEALRGEVARLNNEVAKERGSADQNSMQRDKARAEAARLKAALKLMRDATEGGPDHVSDDDIWAIHDAARKALAGEMTPETEK